MNLADLLDLSIHASLDDDGGLLLDAPKGALTREVIERIRQSKPGLIAEIRGVCEVHQVTVSRAWLLHFTDRDPLEVWTAPPSTHTEALALYPDAVAAEPIPGHAVKRVASTSERDEMLALAEVKTAPVQLCRTCRHRATPGMADPGYCAERANLPKAYGDGHSLRHLPADGGTNCPKWAPHE